MNTNYLLFLYANQKSFDIPSQVQSDLRDKIKESDFLVADDSGTHRLIGLKYYSESKNPPVITCLCMRHEMTAAKQIAFELGKKLYYDSNASARLFKYRAGAHLDPKDFNFVANLYSRFYKPKRHKRIIIKSNGEIYIRDQRLPSYFKLSYLVESLGEPDEEGFHENETENFKYYKWFDYGLEAVTYPGHKGYVGYICIYARETKDSAMHANIDIYLGKDKIENASPFESFRKYGNHFVAIKSLNKEQGLDCKKGEVAMLYIHFGFYPCEYMQAISKDDKGKILSLIKRGCNINRRSGPYFLTPLMYAVIRNKFEIAKLLFENGADPDIKDIYGRTANTVLQDKWRKIKK